jgi:gluconolactonase
MTDASALRVIAGGLHRPEGVCVAPDGTVYVSDQLALIARIEPDGSSTPIGQGGVEPNGLAVDDRGRVVVADYGDSAGLVRVDLHTGTVDLHIAEVDGRVIRRANHPAIDARGRIWCTCSTMADDPFAAVLDGTADGFLFVVDADGGSARIVADGFCFANGLTFSRDGNWLYVAESGARRVSRAVVNAGNATVGTFEPYGQPLGGLPDGVIVDGVGRVWVSLVFERHAVVRIAEDESLTTIVEDLEGTILRNPTNLAFGRPDASELLIVSADQGQLFGLSLDANA